jgi:hypothetical protein
MNFRDAICGNRLVLFPCSPLRDAGLVNNHAYSVLDVRELPGVMPGVQTTLVDYSDWLASDKVYCRRPMLVRFALARRSNPWHWNAFREFPHILFGRFRSLDFLTPVWHLLHSRGRLSQLGCSQPIRRVLSAFCESETLGARKNGQATLPRSMLLRFRPYIQTLV